MLYDAYEAGADMSRVMRGLGSVLTQSSEPWLKDGGRYPAAVFGSAFGGMMGRAGFTHGRPDYGISSVMVGNRDVPVTETSEPLGAFGSLTHFAKDVVTDQPKVLVVAPLSGHFATLLRHTIRTLLVDHDVYVTDWTNARDVPLSEGRFGFDDYVDYVVRFLERIGPGTHMVAVCQPAVQALAAAALMSQTRNDATPASMILMAGPVDTRVNPTKVNELALSKPFEWFERNMIMTVPARHKGAGRRVYPGFLQLSAFMAMKMGRHAKSHHDLFWRMVNGETAEAAQIMDFYDEYFAILDLAGEFYLETIKMVFQDNDLAANRLKYRGEPLDMRAIRRTALMTVEGERDDICAVGQTVAAQDLCTGLRPHRKRHHLQPGVGHYGVFSGSRWEKQVYPRVRDFIQANA